MNPPDLKDAVAYGRRLRGDDHAAFGLSHNEHRVVLLTAAVDDMARALQEAARFALQHDVVTKSVAAKWLALVEAVK